MPMGLSGDEGKDLAGLSEEEFAAKITPHMEEVAELETAFASYMADNGVSFLLTPMTTSPCYNNKSGDMKFDKLEAAMKIAKESGDFKQMVGAFLPLYMPRELGSVKFKLLDLDVPSITVKTSARHVVGDARLPAGVLLWGAPRGDRELLGLAMALEAELAKGLES